MVKVGSRSPWGTIDFVNNYAPGIDSVATPGHGGIKLDRKMNNQVHTAWRQAGGWYEEDCEWAIVAITFPNVFEPEMVKQAHIIAKDWNPDEYREATGNMVDIAESRTLRERAFRAESYGKLKVTCAFGSWHPQCPKGQVIACASLGYPFKDEKAYLIPDDHYEARGPFGFVFEPGTYPVLENFEPNRAR